MKKKNRLCETAVYHAEITTFAHSVMYKVYVLWLQLYKGRGYYISIAEQGREDKSGPER